MISILRAQSLADFHQAHQLIAEMGHWDVSQCDVIGLPSADILSAYYSDDAGVLMQEYTQPRSGMYIARDGAIALGCVGHLSDGEISEITKLFVRSEARGRGVGRLLLSNVLDAICVTPSRRVRLVTASFMTDAIALYRKFGFVDCEPFAAAPKGLEEATRYMELSSGPVS